MSGSTQAAFTTVVLDAQGRVTTHRIEATSVEHAQQIAAGQGHTVLECAAATTSNASSGFLARFKLSESAAVDTVAF